MARESSTGLLLFTVKPISFVIVGIAPTGEIKGIQPNDMASLKALGKPSEMDV